MFEWRKKFPDARPEAVKDFATMTHAYWGTILSVDDSVGRSVETLKAGVGLDNTLIVFMGDNGLLNGEHGMVDKRTMHDPSIRDTDGGPLSRAGRRAQDSSSSRS